jgi:1-acyl-sn-glycerol-3-phosphate acyltransferase
MTLTADVAPKPTAMIWLRSWIYFFAFLAWTIFSALAFLPLLVTKPSALVAVRWWTSGVMNLARIICNIHCRVEGIEHVPPGACIIAAQHQSSFETYRLFKDLEHPIFILKRELTWIPFIGWYMTRAGFVPIDRGAGAGAMRKILREAQLALDKGYQVVVFPEGTRVRPGQQTPYRPGIAALYAQCDLPVVPMALNTGFFWGKTRILKMPGQIVFRFLPVLPRGMDKDTLMTELRSRLDNVAL